MKEPRAREWARKENESGGEKDRHQYKLYLQISKSSTQNLKEIWAREAWAPHPFIAVKRSAAIISSQLFRFTLDSSSNIHRPLASSFVSCAFSRARLILIQLEIWLPYLWLLYFHLPHWSTQLHIFNGFSYFPYLWIVLINKRKFTQKSKLFTWKLWSDFPFNFSLSNFYRTPSTISNGNWFEYVNWQPSLRNYWQNFDTLGAFIRIISNSFETGMLE